MSFFAKKLEIIRNHMCVCVESADYAGVVNSF
jgi:hypothetical protein